MRFKVNKNKILKGIILLLAIGVVATFAWADLKTKEFSSVKKIYMQKLAEQKGKELLNIDRPLLEKIEFQFFKKHQIWKVYYKPKTTTIFYCIGVGEDEVIFLLPADLSKIVEREKLKINKESSLALAELYTKCTSVPNYKIIILKDVNEIPSKESIADLNITPPIVNHKNTEIFEVEFYTWEELKGVVKKWNFKIINFPFFKIEIYQSIIKTGVGDAVAEF